MEAKYYFFLAGVALFLTGLLILVFAIKKRRRCSAVCSAAIAEIIARPAQPSAGKKQSFRPVLTYQVDSKDYTKKAALKTTNFDKYRLGDQLPIRYNPAKPKELLVKGWGRRVLWGILLMLLSAAPFYGFIYYLRHPFPW